MCFYIGTDVPIKLLIVMLMTNWELVSMFNQVLFLKMCNQLFLKQLHVSVLLIRIFFFFAIMASLSVQVRSLKKDLSGC